MIILLDFSDTQISIENSIGNALTVITQITKEDNETKCNQKLPVYPSLSCRVTHSAELVFIIIVLVFIIWLHVYVSSYLICLYLDKYDIVFPAFQLDIKVSSIQLFLNAVIINRQTHKHNYTFETPSIRSDVYTWAWHAQSLPDYTFWNNYQSLRRESQGNHYHLFLCPGGRKISDHSRLASDMKGNLQRLAMFQAL